MSTTDIKAILEAWAKSEGLIHESHGVMAVSSTYDISRKAFYAGYQAATEAAKATGTAGEQWNVVPQTWIDLYVTGSYLAAQLGAIGELDARSPESLKFLSALVGIDGGTVSQRAVDLHEKAHMPLLQAHSLALRECGTPSMQREQAPDTDIFDLIREWAALPEGKRHDAARAIIGCVNRSYSAGVADGKVLGEAARQPTPASEIEPCGGCGNVDPHKRCIGCAHPFRQVTPECTLSEDEIYDIERCIRTGVTMGYTEKKGAEKALAIFKAATNRSQP